jgi:hypothetical protein
MHGSREHFFVKIKIIANPLVIFMDKELGII